MKGISFKAVDWFLRRRPYRSSTTKTGALPLLFVGAPWGADGPGRQQCKAHPSGPYARRAVREVAHEGASDNGAVIGSGPSVTPLAKKGPRLKEKGGKSKRRASRLPFAR